MYSVLQKIAILYRFRDGCSILGVSLMCPALSYSIDNWKVHRRKGETSKQACQNGKTWLGTFAVSSSSEYNVSTCFVPCRDTHSSLLQMRCTWVSTQIPWTLFQATFMTYTNTDSKSLKQPRQYTDAKRKRTGSSVIEPYQMSHLWTYPWK